MKNIIFFLLSLSSVSAQPCLVWQKPTGGIAITKPVWSEQKSDETTAVFLDRIRTKVSAYYPNYTGPNVVDMSRIPGDRYFRDAWHINAARDGVRISRAEAESLQLQHIEELAKRKRSRWVAKKTLCDAEGDEAGSLMCVQKIQDTRSAEATDLTTPTTLQALKECIPWVLKEADPEQ